VNVSNTTSVVAGVEGADWALCCMVNVSNTTSVVAGGVVVFAGVDTYCTVRRMVEHLVSNGQVEPSVLDFHLPDWCRMSEVGETDFDL